MLLEVASLAKRLAALITFKVSLLLVHGFYVFAEIGCLCKAMTAYVAGVSKDPLFGRTQVSWR